MIPLAGMILKNLVFISEKTRNSPIIIVQNENQKINTGTVLLSGLYNYSNSTKCCHNVFYNKKIQGHTLHLVVMYLLSPLICNSFCAFLCISQHCDFEKCRLIILRINLNLGLSSVSSWTDSHCALLAGRVYQGDAGFSVNHIRRHTLLTSSITGNVNFDNLLKVVVSSNFH